MNTQTHTQRVARKVAARLSALAQIAGDAELSMGNGGDVGAMLGGIIQELTTVYGLDQQQDRHTQGGSKWRSQ